MKTKEELNTRLSELSEEELNEVNGGFIPPNPPIRLAPEIGCKDAIGDGWEEPKYILGVGGMQMSTEAKPVE